MEETLEQKVSRLEKEIAELKNKSALEMKKDEAAFPVDGGYFALGFTKMEFTKLLMMHAYLSNGKDAVKDMSLVAKDAEDAAMQIWQSIKQD